jgi:hypothetical protein
MGYSQLHVTCLWIASEFTEIIDVYIIVVLYNLPYSTKPPAGLSMLR